MTESLKPRAWVIYVLKCPDTLAVRYVGWTYNLKKRLCDHRRTAQKHNRHRDAWIRSLLRQDKFPVAEVVDWGTGDWAKAEKKWIAHYRGIGCRLTNLTDGGEGVPGLKMPIEIVERLRQQKIGRKQSPEHIEARRCGMLGRVVTQETRDKISAENSGKIRTPEQRTRNRLVHLGKPGWVPTPEQRKKQSEARKRLYAEHPEKKPSGMVHPDLVGKKFGRWEVIAYAGRQGKHSTWKCLCECGREKIVKATSLKTGTSKSCGCLASEVTAERNRSRRKYAIAG